ncbi:bacterial regulatory helix-turn-helix, lysR family protein, partial [Vibrio parahaemolyticus V-223/04]
SCALPTGKSTCFVRALMLPLNSPINRMKIWCSKR